jgi:hypothetical protein
LACWGAGSIRSSTPHSRYKPLMGDCAALRGRARRQLPPSQSSK